MNARIEELADTKVDDPPTLHVLSIFTLLGLLISFFAVHLGLSIEWENVF